MLSNHLRQEIRPGRVRGAISRLLQALVLQAVFVPAVMAANVEFTFGGVITDVQNGSDCAAPFDNVQVGESWSITYCFDPATPDSHAPPTLGDYNNAIVSYTLTIGGASQSGAPSGFTTIRVFDNQPAGPPPVDQYEVFVGLTNGDQWFMQLDDFTGTAFTDDSLKVCGEIDLTRFTVKDFQLGGGGGPFGSCDVRGTIDSHSCGPCGCDDCPEDLLPLLQDIKAELRDLKAELVDHVNESHDTKAEVADVKAELRDVKAEIRVIVEQTDPCVDAPAPANMVAWWTLDETAPPTSFDTAPADTFPNDGTWNGSPAPMPGYVDGALCFNQPAASGDYVRVPNQAELNFGAAGPTGSFSIDCWINVPSAGAGTIRTIVDKRIVCPSNTRGYTVFLVGNNLALQLADGVNAGCGCGSGPNAPCTNYGGPAIPTGSWVHVAVTANRDGIGADTATFYVNGLPQGPSPNLSAQSGTLSNPADFLIARHAAGTSFTPDLVGCLDEIEVFNRDLTAAEVKAIFDAGHDGKCK